MSRELEALIKAYNDAREQTGDEALRLKAIFQARLDETIAAHPNLDPIKLVNAVRHAHRDWIRAQRKPPTMPPKA